MDSRLRASLAKRRQIRGLYVITDPQICAGQLLSLTWEALRGGARILQYRNKHDPISKQEEQIRALQTLCRSQRVPLIVNDDAELALRTGADGVHVGQDVENLSALRARLGPQRVLGVTCHDSLQLAAHAIQCGADYVSFGAVYPSHTKPEARQVSLDTLQQACRLLTAPVVAIGGITEENAAPLAQRGCRCVAVVGGVFRSGNVRKSAETLSRMFPPI